MRFLHFFLFFVFLFFSSPALLACEAEEIPDYLAEENIASSDAQIFSAFDQLENAPTADTYDPITPDILLSDLIVRGRALTKVRPVGEKLGLIQDIINRAKNVGNTRLQQDIEALMAKKPVSSPSCLPEAALQLLKAFQPFSPEFSTNAEGIRVIGYGTRCDSLVVDCNSIIPPLSESDGRYLALEELKQGFQRKFGEFSEIVNNNQRAVLAAISLHEAALKNAEKYRLSALLRDGNWLGAGFSLALVSPVQARADAEAKLFISPEQSPCVVEPEASKELKKNLLATTRFWEAKQANPALVRPAQISPPAPEVSFWDSDAFYGLSIGFISFAVTIGAISLGLWVRAKKSAKSSASPQQSSPYFLQAY